MEDAYDIVRFHAEIDEIFDVNHILPKPAIQRRYIRDIDNPLEFYSDVQFKKRYRFSKNVVVHHLTVIIQPHLQKVNMRGLPVPPLIALLYALRFYATGSFQLTCGDVRGLSQPSVSRLIKKVSKIIAYQARNEIKMPTTPAEEERANEAYYRLAGFPEVIGCIDCTHIPIKHPGGPSAELYRNNKRTFSINVQVVAGSDLKILDIVARRPGSEHDSIIFNNSALKASFEAGHLHGYLLGDSEYPCLPYLLTPLLHPETDAEIRYNSSHVRTRNVVERLFGMWKGRFPCLAKGLRNKLETVCTIIVACAVLHNIAIDLHDDIDDVLLIQENENIQDDVPNSPDQERGSAQGHGVRLALIARHFMVQDS